MAENLLARVRNNLAIHYLGLFNRLFQGENVNIQ